MKMNESMHSPTPTPPATFNTKDGKWKKIVVFKDGLLMRSSGIPSTHAKEVPNDAQKHVVWTRKQGIDSISLFKHDTTDTWYVHVSNGGRDYVSETFTDITNAKKHASKLREKDNL